MKKILTQEIQVHDFKIGPSKYDGILMDLQISIEGVKHVVFTTSKYLQEAIHLVPKDKFPFSTRIVEIDERFEFT